MKSFLRHPPHTTVFLGFFCLLPGLQAHAQSGGESHLPRTESQVEQHRPWSLKTEMFLPMRGFTLQTGDATDQDTDKIKRLSYGASPTLEGSIQLAYEGLGFHYDRTLLAGSLDPKQGAPPSISEGARFSLLWDGRLLEFSHQRVQGLSADLDVTGTGSQVVARPDIGFSDWRLRGLFGIPIFGSDDGDVRSLSNFYTVATPAGDRVSMDWLASLELNHSTLESATPFVPPERAAIFGRESTLSRLRSSGAGAGIGAGLTVPMSERSFFSMAGLVGGNYDLTDARYQDHETDLSGFGVFMNFRMAVRWMWDHQDLGFRIAADAWSLPAHDNALNTTDASMGMSYGVLF